MDNDIYGHVNNVVYYSYFDTVINRFLIEAGGLDPHEGTVVGMAVETGCRFHRSLAFPDIVQAGLRVGKLGTLQRALRGRHLPQRRATAPAPTATSSTSSSTARPSGRCRSPSRSARALGSA